MDLFLSPHNDDETLFGAFTLLRVKPLVMVVFDSYVQLQRYGITSAKRRQETEAACKILGVGVQFLGFKDSDPHPEDKLRTAFLAIRDRYTADFVYAPAVEETGHEQHNLVGELAAEVFPKVRFYMTYTRTDGKSRGTPVYYEYEWIATKLKALACYESQITNPSTAEHFIRDQHEYYLE